MNVRLDLEFMDDRKSDLPHAPIARVFAKVAMRATGDGAMLLTSDCVTITEFERGLDSLISELESIRKQARAKFAGDDAGQMRRAAGHSKKARPPAAQHADPATPTTVPRSLRRSATLLPSTARHNAAARIDAAGVRRNYTYLPASDGWDEPRE